MVATIDEMPTTLIHKNPEMPLMVVSRATYLELMTKYKQLMSEGDGMMDLIDELTKTVDFYENALHEEQAAHDVELEELLSSVATLPELSHHAVSTSDDYEPGKLKVSFTPEKGFEIAKPKKRKKFAGATLEFDPIKRSLGLGFHFKEVSD